MVAIIFKGFGGQTVRMKESNSCFIQQPNCQTNVLTDAPPMIFNKL